MLETELSIARTNDNPKIVGVRLTGIGQTEGNSFCATFLLAMKKNGGSVKVEKNQVIFKHAGIKSEKGYWLEEPSIHKIEVSEVDAQAIHNLLELRNEYAGEKLSARNIGTFFSGFEVLLTSHKNKKGLTYTTISL